MSITFCEIVGNDCLAKMRVKYNQFLDALNDPQQPEVKIFAPLGKEAEEQMDLVREVTKYLQKKKEEEVNAAEAKRVEEAKAVEAAAAQAAAETPKEQ
ncbi:uncharacterized protein LOC121727383 [Aricia agestis]|uniref:uncharacterized protein LOC121727383 n=1 Tax=Aricia agestis TaxID=91739 RepID=UPI001C2099CC|nr:uncharacterized protein LOC121727383 [Aricia agestis]